MLVKCICTNCAGHLEFEEENAGRKIRCPHCNFETTLTLPGTKEPDPELVDLARRMILRRRLKWIGAALLLLAGLGFALYRWGIPWIQDLYPTLDTTTKAVLALVLGCLALPFALFWLVFPLVLALQLARMNRLLKSISDQLPGATVEAESEAETEPEPETADAKA